MIGNLNFICRLFEEDFIRENNFIVEKDDEVGIVSCNSFIEGENIDIRCYINMYDDNPDQAELLIKTNPQFSEETGKIIAKSATSLTDHKIYLVADEDKMFFAILFTKKEPGQIVRVMEKIVTDLLNVNIYIRLSD